MATKKSTQRRGRFYSLHVTYNPVTHEVRAPSVIHFGDEGMENPIFHLHVNRRPPRGEPVLRLIRGGRAR